MTLNSQNFSLPVRENLVLRFIRPGEAEMLYRLVDANREHLKPWMNWLPEQTGPEVSKKNIESRLQKALKGEELELGIYCDGKLIGSLGFNKLSKRNKSGEIGYWIAKGYEGKGVVTACVKALISFGFEELDLHRIEIGCGPRNARSRAIPEKLGFTFEGIARESYRISGRFEDSRKYSLLAAEWKK